MKKILLGFLCVCFLLSACHNRPQTAPPATKDPPEGSHPPFLQQGIALEEGSNLYYFPNTEMEGMNMPDLQLFGNGLLLSKYIRNQLVLKHISLEDGTLLRETAVSALPGITLCISSGKIGLCDRGLGLISILDESLQLQHSYTIPHGGDDWYLNPGLDTLYVFHFNQGIQARNLATGETCWLVDNGIRVTPIGSSAEYILFSYTDRADQRTYTKCLDLSTAATEILPIDDTISHGTRQGENWLLRSSGSDDLYWAIQGESVLSFTQPDATARLLSPRQHLLLADPSGQNLTLYTPDGTFVSQCHLPQTNNAVADKSFVWCDDWGGYFFTDLVDDSCRLLFWDISAATEGTALQTSPPEHPQPPQPVLDPQLYSRAEALSRRFGVDIRIAEQCTLDYSHYSTYALTDPVFVSSALDTLEECLAMYPEGFFQQLLYDSIKIIRFQVVGALTAKPGNVTHPASVGAFAQNQKSYYTIVLDGFLMRKQTVFHEIAHIIDARLEWDATIREDALYSEEAWMSLQPEGFQYAMSYTQIPEKQLDYLKTDYFIGDSSLTFPEEDRAVLLSAAMENYGWAFAEGSGRREKLRFYANCIRDCFNTDGWPDTPSWEQYLK